MNISRFPLLQKHYEFITSLQQTEEEIAYWLTDDQVVPIKNYSTDKSTILFDPSTLSTDGVLLHTHNGEESTLLSDKDIQTSQELSIPIVMWHTSSQILDYYDPLFPHPYPLTLTNELVQTSRNKLTWYDYLNLLPSMYRCNCYTLMSDIAKALFQKQYPKLNFYNTDYMTAFKNPEALGFKEIKTQPKVGDIALMYLSPEIPYHVAQTVFQNNQSLLAIHIVGGKHRSEIIDLSKWKNNVVSYWEY